MATELEDVAQQGVAQIEGAIIELLKQNPDGLRNADIAERLNLRSDFMGRQKDYLTYSILGGLIRKGKIRRRDDDKKFQLI